MKVDKLKAYLGFAIKSGNVIFGVDKLFESKKTPVLTLVCHTQNEKVYGKIEKFCNLNKINLIKLSNLTLSDLVGRDNCKVISILDINLAQAIENELLMGNE